MYALRIPCSTKHMGGLVQDPATVDSLVGVEGTRSPDTGSEVETCLGIRIAEMLANPDLLVVLAQ